MLVTIDAVGIRGHGGAAVLGELMRWLPVARPSWRWHLFLLDRSLREFDDPTVPPQVTVESTPNGDSELARLVWVNKQLPARHRSLQADVLLSFANIAPADNAIPKVVFCHQPNAFFREIATRRSVIARARLWFLRMQILRGSRAAQTVIVQTEAMRTRIAEFDRSLQQKMRVIPSGYRTPATCPTVRAEKRVLIESSHRPRLVYVTHPGTAKNHETLIAAMPAVLRAYPSASLLLTLEKRRPQDAAYDALVRSIADEASARGVAHRLIWLGILSPDEVDLALRSSDLMVFPSLAESFGLGLVEAMSAGCPVAAADLTYSRDVCGEAADYFAPRDPFDVAKVVIRILSDRARAQALKELGTERKELFSYQRIAENFARALEDAVQSAR